MAITASAVKELRERTGVGIMECKKALQQSAGDIEKAIEDMRKSGVAKAAKKAGRLATEGVIVIKHSVAGDCAVIVEVNSETDFAAKDKTFTDFCDAVARTILASQVADVDALMGHIIDGGVETVEECRQQLVVQIGENINVRRFFVIRVTASDRNRVVNSYLHGTRVGVLVELEGEDDAALAKDIAMHIVASNPLCIVEQGIPEDILAKEREIFLAQAQETGKSEEIIKKMVDGRVKKFLKEVTLLQQSFVKCPDQTIADLLHAAGATVKSYVRYDVGEGLEKQQGNFAEEVMAQAREDR